MAQNPSPYISFMLRLWLENDQEVTQAGQSDFVWRASLEAPHTQKMQIFEDIESLFDFLLKETQLHSPSTNEHSKSHEQET